MPTYEYRCAKCGEHVEVWQSFSDASAFARFLVVVRGDVGGIGIVRTNGDVRIDVR